METKQKNSFRRKTNRTWCSYGKRKINNKQKCVLWQKSQSNASNSNRYIVRETIPNHTCPRCGRVGFFSLLFFVVVRCCYFGSESNYSTTLQIFSYCFETANHRRATTYCFFRKFSKTVMVGGVVVVKFRCVLLTNLDKLAYSIGTIRKQQ